MDLEPDVEAYAFTYRFQIGHELRPSPMSRVRIESERHVPEARLFLDAAGLVDGIEEAAEHLDADVALGAPGAASAEIRPIPMIEWRTSEERHVRASGSLSGLTLSVSAGTEFGIGPSPSDAGDNQVTIRFPRDTDIEVGVRGPGALRKHRVRGMRPVLLNGIPLLEVAAEQKASVDVRMTSPTAVLSLLVVVSPYRRRGASALYHIIEAIGERVAGGTSLQFRV